MMATAGCGECILISTVKSTVEATAVAHGWFSHPGPSYENDFLFGDAAPRVWAAAYCGIIREMNAAGLLAEDIILHR